MTRSCWFPNSAGRASSTSMSDRARSRSRTGRPSRRRRDFSNESLWKAIKGEPGDTYTYLGADNPTLDLTEVDFTDKDLWKQDLDYSILTDQYNLRSVGAGATGAVVALNDIRGGATALLTRADVDAASVAVDGQVGRRDRRQYRRAQRSAGRRRVRRKARARKDRAQRGQGLHLQEAARRRFDQGAERHHLDQPDPGRDFGEDRRCDAGRRGRQDRRT